VRELPIQYQSNNVPNVAAMKTRQDYYQINWPLRTRAQEVGVYAEEVLAMYFPPAIGILDRAEKDGKIDALTSERNALEARVRELEAQVEAGKKRPR
jgi:hypothetical protein